ncbi:MAG: DUF2330 domain-containing protein [Thermoplasmatota archaeon]
MKRGAFAAISVTVVIAVLVLTAIIPGVKGDGCYIPVKPSEVFESGQNAIIAWDGEVERLYLSVNIYADKETTGFHVVPFPSMPEITLGSLSIFENHTRVLHGFEDRYYEGDGTTGDSNWGGRSGVEIVFQEVIGEHDVTVIRVNDVENFKGEMMKIVEEIGIDLRSWPEELNRIITNYTLDGCNYFSVDNYPIYKDEKTVDPLVYEFETDHLFFPLEISSMLDGDSLIRLALFTDPGIPLDRTTLYDLPRRYYPYGGLVPNDILDEIDADLAKMFPGGAYHEYVEFELPLSRVRGDLSIGRDDIISWEVHTNRLVNKDMGWEDRWYYPHYTYNPQRTIISDLGLCLLYNDYDFLNDRMLCMDLADGSILWEWENPQEDTWDEQIDSVSTLDIDNDRMSDILVSYLDEKNRSRVIVRLDPLTGEDIPINSSILDFMPEVTQVFRDVNGTEYLALISSFKMVVIDPKTWEPIAEMDRTEPNEKYGSGCVPRKDYIMHYWEGIGEGFYFFDGKWRWAWSPFYTMSEEELNITGYIDDNIIYQFGFNYLCELEYQGENYVIGIRWNSSHGDDTCIIDMENGGVIDYLSYSDLWELRYPWDVQLVDHDGNGEDEILVISRKETGGREYVHIHCLNPISKVKYWSTPLASFHDMLGYEDMELVDLDDDGEKELVVHSEHVVIVLDISTGDVLTKVEEASLLSGYPDLDRDGCREIITYSERWRVRVLDPFDGHETFNFSTYMRSDKVPYFCGDFDDDGYDDLLFYPSEDHSEGPGPISILDGRTGSIEELFRMGFSLNHFEIHGEDGAYYLLIEEQTRWIGVNLNNELMGKLKENRTKETITILPAVPETMIMDTGYGTPVVEVLIAVVSMVIVLGVYLAYKKWWRPRRTHH